jgi:membrane protease YdiL (CAAX protease family)
VTSIPPPADGPPAEEPVFPPASPPAGEGRPAVPAASPPAGEGRPAFPAAPPPAGDAPGTEDPAATASPAAAHAAEGNARWKPWTAPLALVAWLFMTLVLTLVVAIAAAAMGYSMDGDKAPAGVNIAGTFAQDFAMIAAVLILASLAGRVRGAHLGLARPPIGKAIGAMILVWIGFIGFSIVWKAAISLDDPQTLPDELGINGSTVNLVLVVVIIAVLAPLSEELLFRGYIFGALRNWKGWVPAAVITGLVFGAVHIGSSPIGYALPLAIFGFGLCVLYQRTGSLYPGIALHAVNNAFALGLDQGWSWEIAPVMVGAVAVSVGLAALLARALDSRAGRAVGPLPAAAP